MFPFLTVLQLCDSGFPIGGFSHSLGLESAKKHGFINDKRKFEVFILQCLENAGSFALPFVREAHTNNKDMDKLIMLEELCDASTANHVAKRASIRQGKSLIDTAVKAFDHPYLQNLYDNVDEEKLKGYYPIIYGSVFALLNINCETMLYSFMFSTLRTVIASAVRLDIVGPQEAQRIQSKMQEKIPEIVDRYNKITPAQACIVYPTVDIIQNTHDTMFAKLFYS